MFLTDFRTRKYTRGIISLVGIFLTVTPDKKYNSDASEEDEHLDETLPWHDAGSISNIRLSTLKAHCSDTKTDFSYLTNSD